MTDPATALAGRRERSLLELPSVARMAAILAERCREPSWVRTLVASLDRSRRPARAVAGSVTAASPRGSRRSGHPG